MSTLTIITIAIIALFLLNSAIVVYLKKKGRIPNESVTRKPVPSANAVVLIFMVVFLMVGFGAPRLAPDSAIAGLIIDVGYLVHFAWCLIIGIVIQVVLALTLRAMAKK